MPTATAARGRSTSRSSGRVTGRKLKVNIEYVSPVTNSNADERYAGYYKVFIGDDGKRTFKDANRYASWKTALASRIMAKAAARGWTESKLSAVTGVSVGAIKGLINGTTLTRSDTLWKLAVSMGVEV